MASTEGESLDETHTAQKVRTLFELRQCEDGCWVVTEMDVDVAGTGETGALTAIDYSRKLPERTQIKE